ncbi:hypothetical protein BJ875DRAFT_26523 [Amylocarpus encephaloides]|uniref:Ecp2 effector protein domain-containing protein n=1 Tax=Amylocarpus encephaloides TaxID=45428 RepID=A0A9P8C6I9_9HELO|nr:hypothetical protein BJ875DRAFT_26523 [Amylocarpus encephaloides]
MPFIHNCHWVTKQSVICKMNLFSLLLLAAGTAVAANNDMFTTLQNGLYTLNTNIPNAVPVPFSAANHTQSDRAIVPRHPHGELWRRAKVPVGSIVDCFNRTRMQFDHYYEAELLLHNTCKTHYIFMPGHGLFANWGSATAFFCNIGTVKGICDNYELGSSIDEFETRCADQTAGVVTIPSWGKRYGRFNAGGFAGCGKNSDTGTASKDSYMITEDD